MRALQDRRHRCCCWERIWERNAAQLPRWRETRRDDLDRRLVLTCRSETREATGDGDRLAHDPEVAGSNPVPATKEGGPDQARRPLASVGGRLILGTLGTKLRAGG